MTTIIGLAGSARARSYNRALLRAAIERAPEGVTIVEESIRGVPLYDGDEEAEHGVPARVEELKEKVAAADGLLLVTPEYNHTIPGAFKNTIDWMTRPAKDVPRVFHNKPVGIIGATISRVGTVRAQEAWLPVLKTLNTRPFFGAVLEVARAQDVFDDELTLADANIEKLLVKYVEHFVTFCREQKSR